MIFENDPEILPGTDLVEMDNRHLRKLTQLPDFHVLFFLVRLAGVSLP